MQDDIFSSLCYSVYHMVKTFKKITSSCSLVCKGSLSLSWRMVAIVPICTCPLLQPLCALLPFWLYTISLILFVPQNDMISCISDPLLLISFFCFKYEVPDLQTISFHSSTFFFFFFLILLFQFHSQWNWSCFRVFSFNSSDFYLFYLYFYLLPKW